MSYDVLPLTEEALSGLSPPVPFLDPLSASDGSSFGDSDSTISLPSAPTSPEPADPGEIPFPISDAHCRSSPLLLLSEFMSSASPFFLNPISHFHPQLQFVRYLHSWLGGFKMGLAFLLVCDPLPSSVCLFS